MNFVPIRCAPCATVRLTSASDCRFGETPCPECHGHASVLPGCVYSEEDVPLFEEIREHVQRTDLATFEIWELAAVVDRLRLNNVGGPSITALAEYLPSLEPILTALASNPAKLRRGLNMLSMLVKQRSSGRVSGKTDVPGAPQRQHV